MNNEKMRLEAEKALRASSEEIRVLYNNSRVTNDFCSSILEVLTQGISGCRRS
jgi:hypothetical protein